MANSGEKEGGLFGRKIQFKIGSSSSSLSSRSSSGGGQAPPPPPPPLSSSGSRSVSVQALPPPLARQELSSTEQKALPSHPPPKKEGGLFGRKIEFKIGPSSRSRSSSGSSQAPPPPLSRSGSRSASGEAPPPPPARQEPSSPKHKVLTSHLPPPAPAPPGIRLVAPPWPTGSPPQPQSKLPLALSGPPSDDFAPTGTDSEELSELHSKDQSACEDKELEASYKNQDSCYACEPSVSLKFLAGTTKRTYPGPPSDHCDQTQSPPQKTAGPQDGGAAGQKFKKRRHQLALSIKNNLKLYLENKKLTKDVEIPGTSSDSRVSTVAMMETRLLLRRSAKALYKLHRSEKCLDGSFNLSNFLLDDDMFIHLDFEEESEKHFSKNGARNDFKQFVRTVKEEMFDSEEIPEEIQKWLSLIERDARGYEYLICYHSSLMEYHQTLSTFFSLYQTLQLMQKRDLAGYTFVLDQLKRFDGWTVLDLHNEYFFDTYLGRGLQYQVDYGTDVMSLLRLIRNTFQHITLKTMDENGDITFGPEEFEYMLHDQFPHLIAELMEAMFVAGYLSDLNLEHQMC